jgi:quinol-cytochrome oxidoreductase complex cytochrome b subunit
MSDIKSPEPLALPEESEAPPVESGGLQTLVGNLCDLAGSLKSSIFRHGAPTSDRSRSETVVQNFFLHLHSARIHRWSLRPTFTMGLGLISLFSFIILAVSGVLLMLYYKPTTALAYNSMKEIHYMVPAGRLIRNMHRWAAHLMVFGVMLHMVRVFFTASYKNGRQFNWVIGIILWVLTMALSYTGYLLPWDQLGYWAMVIGTNIAISIRELTDALAVTQYFDPGAYMSAVLVGSETLGDEALIRFNMLHCMFLPLVISVFIGAHFWRIRKDGGMSRPDNADELLGAPPPDVKPVFTQAPRKTYGIMAFVKGGSPAVGRGPENTVPAWPHLFRAEAAVLMCTIVFLLAWAFLQDAPLKELANPLVPENPAKAPWYFLGLQELVSYSAFMGGIGIPTVALLGLVLIPYLDREKSRNMGQWFAGSAREKKVFFVSSLFGLVSVIGLEAFAIAFGWLRNWFPDIPQIIVILINPGTIITGLYMAWSLLVTKKTGSTRLGAVSLFSCFLASFLVLTIIAVWFRGPNWIFYWWPSLWPSH